MVITGNMLGGKFIEALELFGLPKHLIALDVKIRANDPVEVTVTFYPTTEDGGLMKAGEALVQATQTYRLVSTETLEG